MNLSLDVTQSDYQFEEGDWQGLNGMLITGKSKVEKIMQISIIMQNIDVNALNYIGLIADTFSELSLIIII